MKLCCTLLAVADMARSRRFYTQLLDLEVEHDFGANLSFYGGLSLQTAESWRGFLGLPEGGVRFGGSDAELYFDCGDLDAFVRRLEAWPGLQWVHPLKQHDWGQRVVRFRDPDGHIIEVGEPMELVCRRFLSAGLTVGQTAARSQMPLEFVRRCAAQTQQ